MTLVLIVLAYFLGRWSGARWERRYVASLGAANDPHLTVAPQSGAQVEAV